MSSWPDSVDDLLPSSLMAPAIDGTGQPRSVLRAGFKGTTIYRAPELMARHSVAASTFTALTKADVYSFGITVWEMSARRMPFENYPGGDPATVKDVIVKRGARPDGTYGNGVRWAIRDAATLFDNEVKQCWAVDINERPTAEYLKIVFR